ncbi:hypothetical protein niasHT_017265 [Heterodera trifolii]|uniref:Peptidase S1 domain-containing protein n=1 Tax=Heterodera trifolii TaxID=157864 RepID=A0ABD2LH10_9BILA
MITASKAVQERIDEHFAKMNAIFKIVAATNDSNYMKYNFESDDVQKMVNKMAQHKSFKKVILCYQDELFVANKSSIWKVSRRFRLNDLSNLQNKNCAKDEKEVQVSIQNGTFSIGTEHFKIGHNLSEVLIQLSSMESSYAKIITNDGEAILSKFGKEIEFQIANGAFLEEYGGFWLMGVAILRKIGQKDTKIRVDTSENCEFNVIIKYEPPKCHTFNGRKRFGRHINPLIHGGHKVNIKHVPWNIRFIGEVKHKNGRTTKVLCSGTLISSEYVLLAAHCVQNVTEGQTFHIGYNLSSADDMFNNANGALSTAHQRRNNFNVFIHPSYRPDPKRIGHAQYDQAIIKLNCVLRGPIYPVCIHCGNAKDFRAGKAFVSGWGQEEDDCKEKGHGATLLMGRFVQLTEVIAAELCWPAMAHILFKLECFLPDYAIGGQKGVNADQF